MFRHEQLGQDEESAKAKAKAKAKAEAKAAWKDEGREREKTREGSRLVSERGLGEKQREQRREKSQAGRRARWAVDLYPGQPL